MAFWGVEVKPGKPFTHEYDATKGRLHISMATLGFGTATVRSTLQCNVGNRSPVYICSLYPGTTESLQLNLELEEVEKVIFSVLGPRSFHLCGYYLGRSSSRNGNFSDDSESYGEDIANTETDRSDSSDEDEYGGSFIDDDGDPKFAPLSPISDEEEAFQDNRTKGRKSSRRRLRRKYQSVESDDNEDLEENIMVGDSMDDQKKEIDDEDSLPISSIAKKNEASQRIVDGQMNDSGDQGAGGASIKNNEYTGSSILETDLITTNVLQDSQTHRDAELAGQLVDPCTVLDVEDIKTLKMKGKGKEIKSSVNVHVMKLENTVQDGPKEDKMTSDLLEGNQQNQEHVDDKDIETLVKILPSSEGGHGEGEKPKNKRKERSNGNLVDLPEIREHNKQPTDNGNVDYVAQDSPIGKQNEGKIKRKKKKSKSRENIEVNSQLLLSAEKSCEMDMEYGNKRANEKHLQSRTLSNGLVIQELQTGKKDGKISASGKKISIHYTGKLKENGEVFESNSGQAPFKFRLGKGEVIEGWDVGLEGMRVGEKRRLIIPPSMTFPNEEYSEKVPPNSWLVYDIELVKVH